MPITLDSFIQIGINHNLENAVQINKNDLTSGKFKPTSSRTSKEAQANIALRREFIHALRNDPTYSNHLADVKFDELTNSHQPLKVKDVNKAFTAIRMSMQHANIANRDAILRYSDNGAPLTRGLDELLAKGLKQNVIFNNHPNMRAYVYTSIKDLLRSTVEVEVRKSGIYTSDVDVNRLTNSLLGSKTFAKMIEDKLYADEPDLPQGPRTLEEKLSHPPKRAMPRNFFQNAEQGIKDLLAVTNNLRDYNNILLHSDGKYLFDTVFKAIDQGIVTPTGLMDLGKHLNDQALMAEREFKSEAQSQALLTSYISSHFLSNRIAGIMQDKALPLDLAATLAKHPELLNAANAEIEKLDPYAPDFNDKVATVLSQVATNFIDSKTQDIQAILDKLTPVRDPSLVDTVITRENLSLYINLLLTSKEVAAEFMQEGEVDSEKFLTHFQELMEARINTHRLMHPGFTEAEVLGSTFEAMKFQFNLAQKSITLDTFLNISDKFGRFAGEMSKIATENATLKFNGAISTLINMQNINGLLTYFQSNIIGEISVQNKRIGEAIVGANNLTVNDILATFYGKTPLPKDSSPLMLHFAEKYKVPTMIDDIAIIRAEAVQDTVDAYIGFSNKKMFGRHDTKLTAMLERDSKTLGLDILADFGLSIHDVNPQAYGTYALAEAKFVMEKHNFAVDLIKSEASQKVFSTKIEENATYQVQGLIQSLAGLKKNRSIDQGAKADIAKIMLATGETDYNNIELIYEQVKEDFRNYIASGLMPRENIVNFLGKLTKSFSSSYDNQIGEKLHTAVITTVLQSLNVKQEDMITLQRIFHDAHVQNFADVMNYRKATEGNDTRRQVFASQSLSIASAFKSVVDSISYNAGKMDISNVEDKLNLYSSSEEIKLSQLDYKTLKTITSLNDGGNTIFTKLNVEALRFGGKISEAEAETLSDFGKIVFRTVWGDFSSEEISLLTSYRKEILELAKAHPEFTTDRSVNFNVTAEGPISSIEKVIPDTFVALTKGLAGLTNKKEFKFELKDTTFQNLRRAIVNGFNKLFSRGSEARIYDYCADHGITLSTMEAFEKKGARINLDNSNIDFSMQKFLGMNDYKEYNLRYIANKNNATEINFHNTRGASALKISETSNLMDAVDDKFRMLNHDIPASQKAMTKRVCFEILGGAFKELCSTIAEASGQTDVINLDVRINDKDEVVVSGKVHADKIAGRKSNEKHKAMHGNIEYIIDIDGGYRLSNMEVFRK